MSVTFFERPAVGHGAWQAFADIVGSAVKDLQRRQKRQRDRRHLMELPDYLLRDIGLSRIEIDCMSPRDDCEAFLRRI